MLYLLWKTRKVGGRDPRKYKAARNRETIQVEGEKGEELPSWAEWLKHEAMDGGKVTCIHDLTGEEWCGEDGDIMFNRKQKRDIQPTKNTG